MSSVPINRVILPLFVAETTFVMVRLMIRKLAVMQMLAIPMARVILFIDSLIRYCVFASAIAACWWLVA